MEASGDMLKSGGVECKIKVTQVFTIFGAFLLVPVYKRPAIAAVFKKQKGHCVSRNFVGTLSGGAGDCRM